MDAILDFLDPDQQHNLPLYETRSLLGVYTFYSPCNELRCLWLRIQAFFLNRIHGLYMNPHLDSDQDQYGRLYPKGLLCF
jgi:hypothetical protein